MQITSCKLPNDFKPFSIEIKIQSEKEAQQLLHLMTPIMDDDELTFDEAENEIQKQISNLITQNLKQ